MAVTAYLEAARVLRLDDAREFALLTLRRLLVEAWGGADLLRHVIAYPQKPGGDAQERVAGTLDDYAFTVHACLDGWIASGRMEFYHAATTLADAMIARFHDGAAGAFYDTAADAGGEQLGALTARRKPLQDSPTPAGNPTAASALLRLESLSGRKEYREIAEDTLESFAGIVEHFGLYAGSYGLALERLLAGSGAGGDCGFGAGGGAAGGDGGGAVRGAEDGDADRAVPNGAGRGSAGTGTDAAERPCAGRGERVGDCVPRANVPAADYRCGGAAGGDGRQGVGNRE